MRGGDRPPVDLGVPSIARMYDYWLGGSDSFAADRAAAAEVERLFPGTRLIAVRNRLFLGRAVTWLAQQGVGQFLDLGAGIPTRGETEAGGERVRIIPVHEAARAVFPSARVVYVDSDPVAVAHARAMATAPGVIAIRADLTDAAAVLADWRIGELIDLRRPAGLIFGMVLHFLSGEQARQVVAAYSRAAAPGSYVVISAGHNDDDEVFRQVRELVRRSGLDLFNHSAQDIAGFFDGMDLLDPGVVPARGWRPGWHDCLEADGSAYALAGVGRVR